MPDQTPRFAFPFPLLSEPPNGPDQLKVLAEAVEATLIAGEQIVPVGAANAPVDTYPLGLSMSVVTVADAAAGQWPWSSSAQLLTVKTAADRASQFWFRNSLTAPEALYRNGNINGGWSAWRSVAQPETYGSQALGQVSFTRSQQSVAVTFPAGKFESGPRIMLTGNTRGYFYTTSARSATGFTANVGRFDGSDVAVATQADWAAFG